ncbi:type IV secretory system conjugative DNA transfer family protein [Cellulomonas fimi]|uniref:type IV secretory system conjugative DNA transfer family protein n=1 Tax=Cellulomonas fimi TaxID=1708 RepID=UPI00234D0B56|nr:type IV secretory system conjugative DNA transfer family protein [Cellulomonas fimi]MDC7120262.1 type IV secretory system conjugative DNA transfer family protein [Cellulomonas fimi]
MRKLAKQGLPLNVEAIEKQATGDVARVTDGTPAPRRPGFVKQVKVNPALTERDAEQIEDVLADLGLDLVGFDPKAHIAYGAELPNVERDLRNALADGERWPRHRVGLYTTWTYDADADDPHLATVVVARYPRELDADRRARTWDRLVHSGAIPGSRGFTWEEIADGEGRSKVVFSYSPPPKLRLPFPVSLLAMLPDRLDPEAWPNLPVGIDAADRVFAINVKTQPHTLASGDTGAGKGQAMLALTCQGLARGFDVVVADADKKANDWLDLVEFLSGFAQDYETEGALIVKLHKEMTRRININTANGVAAWYALPRGVRERENIRPILAILDEFVNFVTIGKIPNFAEDSPHYHLKVEAEALQDWKLLGLNRTESIAMLSRAAGIYLVLGGQRFDAGIVGGILRMNVTNRLQCATAKSRPARETLIMNFAGQQADQAADLIDQYTRDGRPGLAIVGGDGGKAVAIRVPFDPNPDGSGTPDTPGYKAALRALGVPDGRPFGPIAGSTPFESDEAPARTSPPPWGGGKPASGKRPARGKAPARDYFDDDDLFDD